MFDPEVECRLRQWAKWWLDVHHNKEGYPKKSAIALFSEGSLALREEFKSIPLISNEYAMQVNMWLLKMSLSYPEYFEAVTLFYLTTKSASQLSELLCISKRTFYQRLDGARTWLSGVITYHENYS